mgnify:FL=1
MANGHWSTMAGEIEGRIVAKGVDGVTEKDLLILLVAHQSSILQPKWIFGTAVAVVSVIMGGAPVAGKAVELVTKVLGS